MVGVDQSEGHHDVSGAYVECSAERLLQPELLELHLATFLLLVLKLDGRAGATVLKLNLATHRPTLSEVVAQVDDGMGNVETAMARVVLIGRWLGVAIAVVAVEVAAESSLAITAYAQALAAGMVQHRVGSAHLGLGDGQSAKNHHACEQS